MPQATPTASAPSAASQTGQPKILSNSPKQAAARPPTQPHRQVQVPGDEQHGAGHGDDAEDRYLLLDHENVAAREEAASGHAEVQREQDGRRRTARRPAPRPAAAARTAREFLEPEAPPSSHECPCGRAFMRLPSQGGAGADPAESPGCRVHQVPLAVELGEQLLVHGLCLVRAQHVREIDLGGRLASMALAAAVMQALPIATASSAAVARMRPQGLDGLDHEVPSRRSRR